jgi:predicted alpha/beta-fold hydrolase
MIISSTFSPPFYLKNPHLQTFWGGLAGRLLSIPPPSITRHEGSGKDFFEVATWSPSARSLGRIVILHGLEGSLQSGYLRSLIQLLTRIDRFSVEVICLRGCGTTINRVARAYHSGFTDDLRSYLSLQDEPVLLVGFSIGGNIALKYLGEEGSSASRVVAAAIAISTPGNLSATAASIAKNPIYQRYFISAFHRKHRLKVASGIASPSFADFSSISSFYDYDSRFTAPLFGYSSAEEYWHENSCCRFIDLIRVKCRMISALDDPFFSRASFPEKECRDNHWVDLELSQWGGHVGFIGSPLLPSYSETQILETAATLFSWP